jgi:hypothetical protein
LPFKKNRKPVGVYNTNEWVLATKDMAVPMAIALS